MSKPATPSRPLPSRRLPLGARLRGRQGRIALWAVAVLAAFAGGWGLWYGGAMGRVADLTADKVLEATARFGFAVDDVMVVGREQTDGQDLMRAVDLRRGTPILDFDTEAAKARVEALSWVHSAAVERVLPGTVLVRIQERQPLALWQHQGRVRLIDHEGREIETGGLERFTDLLLVVGSDAPEHTAALLHTLQTEPELMMRVEAAIRVGERRWNVRLEDGIDVRLPEENPADAWHRLAEYERKHGVLGRDVEVLDLRLPDRLIVRSPNRPETVPAPAARVTTDGRQT